MQKCHAGGLERVALERICEMEKIHDVLGVDGFDLVREVRREHRTVRGERREYQRGLDNILQRVHRELCSCFCTLHEKKREEKRIEEGRRRDETRREKRKAKEANLIEIRTEHFHSVVRVEVLIHIARVTEFQNCLYRIITVQ